MKDTYKTIASPSEEVLFKDRNSKFFGYAFAVQTQEQATTYLEQIKQMHSKARHWCYAWQIGKEETTYHYRTYDDGEPSNSAGMPIYGQIQSFDLTNILIVVVRYFGGVKLGVGGLINAYKTTAQMALENSEICCYTIDKTFILKFDYPQMNVVMRTLKEHNLNILKQDLNLDCRIYFSVRKKQAQDIREKFQSIHKVKISEKED